MAKRIIVYNLKDTISDEEYREYCETKKGPFLSGLPSCKNFTLVRVLASKKGEILYRYVGIVDVTSQREWERDSSSAEFQSFLNEWTSKVAEFNILEGEEVYGS